MTKEFLLISRGIESEVNKMRLAETISKFDSTLQDLKTGNPEGIICSICLNASEVLVSIQNVLDLWVPFQRILTENVDSIRDVDGSVDHKVLEDLSSKTEPLFKACDEVVSRLIIQAKAAHQWQHSLVEEVAFRQRTLIQRMAKSLLFLSQGVSMASNMESLGETKSVFEASHQGIIRGVPFAGVPVLTKLCTMHQLSVVTLYYQQLRPLLNRVMNSVTSSEAQQAADEVATDVVSSMEPLFDAMVGAVELVMNDNGSCQPWTAMSSRDWRFFVKALAHQRLLTQQILQEVTQVAMKVDVRSAQVEIIVHDSEATENLRSLIEGNGLLGIPPPPTQQMLNNLLEIWELWETMEVEIQNVVHLDMVSDAMILRVFRLSKEVLLHLEIIIQKSLEMVRNTTVPGYQMNFASEQAVLVSKVVEEACLINLGIEVNEKWQILNKSRELVKSRHFQLLQGTQETSPPIVKIANVCLVQQMKAAMDLFSELDQEVLAVAHGAAPNLLIELGPSCVKAFDEVSSSTGENISCENQTLSPDEWKTLHREAAELAILGEAIPAEFIQVINGKSLTQLEFLMKNAEVRLRRMMFGSWQPPIAAPPNQEYFNDMLHTLDPAVRAITMITEADSVLEVLAAGQALRSASSGLQRKYLQEVNKVTEPWSKRVDVALQQMVLAHEIFKEIVLQVFDIHSNELMKTISQFEVAHIQLKDGGDGIPSILLPERIDLLNEWQLVDEAWNEFKEFQTIFTPADIRHLEKSLLNLVTHLETMVPLFAIEDVKEPEKFPWAVCIYSVLASFLAMACCIMMCAISKYRIRKTTQQKEKLEEV